MKLRQFPIRTDQNIHTDVVNFLQGEGLDVIDVEQAGLLGAFVLVAKRSAEQVKIRIRSLA